jgi:hypothetical protein
MKLFRTIPVLALLCGVICCALTGEAAAQPKNGKNGKFGKVLRLDLRKDDDGRITGGSFVVESRKKNQKEPVEITFKVGKDTKFLKEKDGNRTEAKVDDLKAEVFVHVLTAENAADLADTIIFVEPKKKQP